MERLIPDLVRSPYPGLRPFESHEAAIFFGREEQVEGLRTKLLEHHFVGVVGPSGCGKSSLVWAGLIPDLRGDLIGVDRESWQVVRMRPGDRPLLRMAQALVECGWLGQMSVGPIYAALARGSLGLVDLLAHHPLPASTKLLVVADQFEEVFRIAVHRSPEQAEAFVALLLHSAECARTDAVALPIYVALTMRSDFLGDCARFPSLPEALNESQFLTPRLTRSQRRATILGPAALFSISVEELLVNRLLNEMGDEPDQLPILQHALMRLWRDAGGVMGKLTDSIVLADTRFDRLGGWEETLSRHADEAFEELAEAGGDRRIARLMFQALTERGDDNRDTRRPATAGEIAGIASAKLSDVTRVVDVFRQAGRSFLLPPGGAPLTNDTILDISHESLIRNWKLLQEWVVQESESAQTYQRLRDWSADWKKGEGALWENPNLGLALEWEGTAHHSEPWAARYEGDYRLALEFLRASEAAWKKRKAEQAKEKRRRLVLRWMVVAAVVLLALVYWALGERGEAQRQAERAREQTGIAEAAAAVAKQREEEAKKLQSEANQLARREGEAAEAARVARKEADEQREVAQENAERATTSATAANAAREEADKQREIAENNERWAKETLVDAGFALEASRLSGELGRDIDALGAWTFSVGRTLAGELGPRPQIPHAVAGLRRQLDAVRASLPFGQLDGVPLTGVRFAGAGDILVTTNRVGAVHFWNPESGEHLGGSSPHDGPVRLVAASPTDLEPALVTAGLSQLFLWSLSSPWEDPTPEPLEGHDGTACCLAFSADGTTLVVGYRERMCRVWDLRNAPKLQDTRSTQSSVSSVAISPQGDYFLSGDDEGQVRLWHLGGKPVIELLPPGKGAITWSGFAPDSGALAVASADQGVTLWHAPTTEALATLRHDARVNIGAFFQVGGARRFVAGCSDATARVWDVASGELVAGLAGHRGSIVGLGLLDVVVTRDAVERAEQRIFTIGNDATIRFWHPESGKPAGTPLTGHRDDRRIVAFDMDVERRRLATASWDGTARVWSPSATRLLVEQPKDLVREAWGFLRYHAEYRDEPMYEKLWRDLGFD
ncbi:MAG: hypothetical protein AAF628_35780 [Planctomycetota bacterium]